MATNLRKFILEEVKKRHLASDKPLTKILDELHKERKMITERTLKKWRKEALISFNGLDTSIEDTHIDLPATHIKELNSRILRMTQELLDQCLTRHDK